MISVNPFTPMKYYFPHLQMENLKGKLNSLSKVTLAVTNWKQPKCSITG